MRIFYSFLVVFVSAILWMLPITEGIYDFRTDVKTDTFYYTTGGAEVSANLTLIKELYDEDLTTISISSNVTTDTPAASDYHTATQILDITGLTASTSYKLLISYDYDALNTSDAIDTALDKVGVIWMILIIAFPAAAIAAMFLLGRKRS